MNPFATLFSGTPKLEPASGVPVSGGSLPPLSCTLANDLFHNGEGRRRSDIFKWLAAIFERHAGFQSTEVAEKKLAQHYSTLSLEQLELLALQLKGLPFSTPEWQTLLDLLTVHETYFYRDAPQLEHVKTNVLPKLIDTASRNLSFRLRVWSAGCSSGEELFMLLLMVLNTLMQKKQARWLPNGELEVHPSWRLEFVGSDISGKVLEQARSGRYACNHRMSSFRDLPVEYRAFFQFPAGLEPPPTHGGVSSLAYAKVKPSVLRWTRFMQQNITECPPCPDPYDLIFCRNVLIYFNEDTKLRVQQTLQQSLRKGGFLVLGPPDTLLLPKLFQRQQGALAVCYEKI